MDDQGGAHESDAVEITGLSASPWERLSPTQKGDLAEASIVAELCSLAGRGYEVLKPATSGCRYDLAIGIGHQFYRVQCKFGRIDRGAIRFWASSSKRRQGQWRKEDYSADADLLVCFCPDTNKCYAIAASEAPLTMVSLAITEGQANQFATRRASDHELATVLLQLEDEGR